MVEVEGTSYGWRLTLKEGQDIVSRATLYRLHMRIEDATLPVGGMAGVFTEERARGRGYARRIVERALDLMKAEGIALSYLYGIPALYNRWGYRTCTSLHEVRVQTQILDMYLRQSRVPSIVSHRTATQADRDEIAAIYRLDNSGRTGTLVRETSPWPWFRHGSALGRSPVARVVEKPNGTIDSYAVFDKEIADELVVAELGCSTWSRFPLLLRLLVSEAVRRNCRTIRLIIPLDYPATHYLKYVGIESRAEYPSDGAGMSRIIDLGRTLDNLLPVLERRLKHSSWSGHERQFSLQTDIGSLSFTWDGSLLTHGRSHSEAPVILRSPQEVLTAAIWGHIPGDQLALFGARVAPGEGGLLRTLFPPADPFMWRTDWF